MEELEKQIAALQAELAIAIDNDDLARAHELETEIDTLQQQVIRLKQ